MAALWVAIGAIVAGIVLLIGGGELLVRGASRLAHALRVPPLVMGLTVVAFGTSSPELAVSLKSAWNGQADIAVGNVVGSSIFNVLFILGAAALIVPLKVSRQLVRLDVPYMIVTTLLAFLLAWDGRVSQWDGAFLFLLLVVYVTWSVLVSRRVESPGEPVSADATIPAALPTATHLHFWANVGYVVIGLLGLGWGSNWLVGGATTIAQLVGISELVIGLTIVSIGTSLPEVAASLIASLRGERDIAVGNVVGSNIFNVLCVLGVTAMAAHDGVGVSPGLLSGDFPILIGVSLAALPIFYTGHGISRGEGIVFLGYYFAYVTHLILQATENPLSDSLSTVFWVCALPVTVGGLLIATARSLLTPFTSADRSKVVDQA